MTGPERPLVAGGQVQRVAGVARDIAVHEQLYRYAHDLQALLDDKNDLEQRYETLAESYRQLGEGGAILENLVKSSHDIHLTTTPAGTIMQSNAAASRLAPASVLVGQSLRAWVLPSHQADFDSLLADARTSPEASLAERELWLRGPATGTANLITAVRLLPIFKDSEVEAIHWMVRDLTRAREAEFDSQISSLVFRSTTEGIMITDLEGDILAVNPAFSKITGYKPHEVIGRSPRILKSGVQDANFYHGFWSDLKEKGQWQGEVFNRKKSGEIYPEWLTVTAASDNEGRILSYIAVFSDMSRLREAEKRLSYIAYHDTLTGLPNRLLFQDRLAQTLAQAKRSGIQFTLIFIDLDKFKPINDTLGHAVGDRVLQEAAKRLSGSVRECDTVARLGGDEFVILAPGLAGDADIGGLCNKMLDALRQPIRVQGTEVFIGGSFGCAKYPNQGDDAVVLLKCADAAMYAAKAAGGNSYAIYDGGAMPVSAAEGAS